METCAEGGEDCEAVGGLDGGLGDLDEDGGFCLGAAAGGAGCSGGGGFWFRAVEAIFCGGWSVGGHGEVQREMIKGTHCRRIGVFGRLCHTLGPWLRARRLRIRACW